MCHCVRPFGRTGSGSSNCTCPKKDVIFSAYTFGKFIDSFVQRARVVPFLLFRQSLPTMLFWRSFSALLFRQSLSATSCHPRFSRNWRQFIWFQHTENIHSNSLFSSPFSTPHSLKVLSISYGFVSISCFDECTSKLKSCVNLEEKSTSRLAPRSVEIAFRAVVRHDTTIPYWSVFTHFSYRDPDHSTKGK